jgi:hypothetical protein
MRARDLLNLPLLFFSTAAAAEITNCNGTWTNRGCGGSPGAAKVNEVRANTDPEKIKALSRKRTIFHELNMKNIAARRDLGIILDLNSLRQLCEDESISIEECERSAAGYDDQLSRQITDVRLVREKERANELLEEANRIQQERNDIEAERNLIQAVQDGGSHGIIFRRRPKIKPIDSIEVNVKPQPPPATAGRPKEDVREGSQKSQTGNISSFGGLKTAVKEGSENTAKGR